MRPTNDLGDGPRGTSGGSEDYAEIVDDEGDYSTPASKFIQT